MMTIFNLLLLAALAALVLTIVITGAIFVAGLWLITSTTAVLQRRRQATQEHLAWLRQTFKFPDPKRDPIILDLADLEKETS